MRLAACMPSPNCTCIPLLTINRTTDCTGTGYMFVADQDRSHWTKTDDGEKFERNDLQFGSVKCYFRTWLDDL